jgi:hypothetical protein
MTEPATATELPPPASPPGSPRRHNDCQAAAPATDGESQRTDRVFLPFEGDRTLSVILSKALLLADDKKITDPTIMRQIRS